MVQRTKSSCHDFFVDFCSANGTRSTCLDRVYLSACDGAWTTLVANN